MRSELLRYAVRRIPYRQLVGAALLCAVLLAAGGRRVASTTELLPLVRLAALTLACVSTSALLDPASTVNETTAAGRLRLRTTAAALTFATVAGIWFLLLAATSVATGISLRSLAAGLLLELAALYAAGLVIASTALVTNSSRLVPAWGAAMLVGVTAASVATTRTRVWLWTEPGFEWHRSHVRWAWLAVAAVSVFLVASRDPAGRSLRRPA